MPALQLLREVGAERAEPVLEEPRELLPLVLVGELDSHSPVVGHPGRIVRLPGLPVSPPNGGPTGSGIGRRYSRISIAWASRSRSMYGSPLTSTATRRIVPPVKRYGSVPG